MLQGDFYQWLPVINHFDQLLEESLKDRKDLDLSEIDPDAKDNAELPHDLLLAIVRATITILENCANKHMYHSYEVMTLHNQLAHHAPTHYSPASTCIGRGSSHHAAGVRQPRAGA
eukprot:scaffold397314_cov48-Prasinocladus_malaysianus.AAC.1